MGSGNQNLFDASQRLHFRRGGARSFKLKNVALQMYLELLFNKNLKFR